MKFILILFLGLSLSYGKWVDAAGTSTLLDATDNGSVSSENEGNKRKGNPDSGCEDIEKIDYFIKQTATEMAQIITSKLFEKKSVDYSWNRDSIRGGRGLCPCSDNLIEKRIRVCFRAKFRGGALNKKYLFFGKLSVDFDGSRASVKFLKGNSPVMRAKSTGIFSNTTGIGSISLY